MPVPGLDPADRDVVHGAAAGGRDLVGKGLGQGPEQDVHDPLGGLHVAAGRRRRKPGVHHASLRRGDADRAHQPGAGRSIVRSQTAENVVDGGPGDGADGVEAAGNLGSRPRKIDLHGIPRDPDADANRDRLRSLLGAALIQQVLGRVAAVRDPANGLAHDLRRIVLQSPAVLFDLGSPVLFDQRPQPPVADSQRPHLRGQIPFPLEGCADVAEEEAEQVDVQSAPPVELGRRNPDSLLKDIPAQGHGAGGHSPHVRVMGANGHMEDGADELVRRFEHGRHHGEIGQVGPPAKGSLRITTSPGRNGSWSRAAWTDMGMEPRWTGIWSPMATSCAFESKSAQE